MGSKKRMVRRLTIPHLLAALRKVRREIEDGTGGLTEEQALLFADICQALKFNASSTYYVIGEAFDSFVTSPLPITVKTNGNGRLGPPGGDHPGSISPKPQCTFCEKEALAAEYVDPPMCSGHFTVSIIANLLKNHGHPVTDENIRLFVEQKPRTLILPDEVESLFEPLREVFCVPA